MKSQNSFGKLYGQLLLISLYLWIQETYDFIAGKGGLWEKGYCSYCYTSPLTETSNLTDDAVTFFALYGSVQDCFAAHPENQSLSLGVTKSEACKECAIDYWKLKSFYRDQFLEDESPDATGVCFDILDAMNSTQHRKERNKKNLQ